MLLLVTDTRWPDGDRCEDEVYAGVVVGRAVMSLARLLMAWIGFLYLFPFSPRSFLISRLATVRGKFPIGFYGSAIPHCPFTWVFFLRWIWRSRRPCDTSSSFSSTSPSARMRLRLPGDLEREALGSFISNPPRTIVSRHSNTPKKLLFHSIELDEFCHSVREQ